MREYNSAKPWRHLLWLRRPSWWVAGHTTRRPAPTTTKVASLLVALASFLGCATADELLVFTRSGCAPCESLKAAIKADPSLVSGFDVQMIDTKADPALARRYRVKSVPVVVVVRDGKEVRRTTGFTTPEAFRSWVRKTERRRR